MYGGWITAFVRTVVSELMNNVHDQGGKIISCTTFITDMKDLENYDVESNPFCKLYKDAILDLVGKAQPLLEI